MLSFHKLKLIRFSLLFLFSYSCIVAAGITTTATDTACYPNADFTKTQYLIGYGSLVQNKSKNRTSTLTGESSPIIVQGYQRGWFARGISAGFSTTYLGVIKNPNAFFNAVMFKIKSKTGYLAYDQRENYYCRVPVAPTAIEVFKQENIKNAQIWLYALKPEYKALPSSDYPIVQSYVGIFLSGCLYIQNKYHLVDFAKQCINTTTDWSAYWVDDRIYPRRPFIYQPQADAIDQLLSQQLPEIFKKIKLE